ncbi:ATP-dependent DNA ligase [Candidatus Gottesmanbacteria bacterium]|nr:ATP-dependent DNA ligase [Candidatus Gottesmanbacteria bacterium]
MKNLDSLSVRYIVRIPLNKMRLGFSDMSILDALSFTISGNKEYREEIEKAYNVRPDLGYIATKIKKNGISGIKHIEPTIGVPILMAKADRLTSPTEILDKIGSCAVEFKYDGLRLQVHYKKAESGKGKGASIKLYSRNLEDVTHMFPDIVEGVKKQVSADEVIFEGEVVAYNPKNGVFIPFQQTMQRKRKYDIAKKALEIPVKLFAFELLYDHGKNYIALAYKTRKEKLRQIIKQGSVIIYAQETIVSKESQIDQLFSESVKKGFEGIIAKKLDGVYQAGMRGFNWIKFKRAMSKTLTDTFDVLVMGYTKGEGKRTAFGVGQFLTGVYDSKSDKFVTVSKIGTGLTDEQFKEFYKRVKPLERKDRPLAYDVDKLLEADHWLTPSLVVEVAADEITRSQVHTAGRIMGPSKNKKAFAVVSPGYALRFPRLIRFRDDKKPKDATTLTEVIKMFGSQNHKA